jgi:hypothetical protein
MTLRSVLIAVAALIAAQGIALYLLGQPPLCECGTIKFWHGVVLSDENSQQLTDWYTFSHVIHGFIFYLALRFLFPRMPMIQRLILALGIEVAWEVIENTPMVIDHYREQALAQGYIGDSILNSLMDTLAMFAGFILAYRLPVWSIVLLGLGFELFVGYMIRDNLLLNVLGFVHVFPFITEWQSGA